MVETSSRILSCEVWLILMRNTSAPASNSLRIIALSDEAGPRVARILMRRSRLIVWAPRLAADQARLEACRPATGRVHHPGRPDPRFRECPARARARVVRWLRPVDGS